MGSSSQRIFLGQRVFLGAAAGALSMLLFHQTALQVFFMLGLAPHSAFRTAVVPPFGVPAVVSACFWAALIGAGYAAVVKPQGRHAWLTGLPLGCAALLLVWFVVLPLKQQPAAFGWHVLPLVRSATASLIWGLGVGVLLPLMLPRRFGRGTRGWAGRRITV